MIITDQIARLMYAAQDATGYIVPVQIQTPNGEMIKSQLIITREKMDFLCKTYLNRRTFNPENDYIMFDVFNEKACNFRLGTFTDVVAYVKEEENESTGAEI